MKLSHTYVLIPYFSTKTEILNTSNYVHMSLITTLPNPTGLFERSLPYKCKNLDIARFQSYACTWSSLTLG